MSVNVFGTYGLEFLHIHASVARVMARQEGRWALRRQRGRGA